MCVCVCELHGRKRESEILLVMCSVHLSFVSIITIKCLYYVIIQINRIFCSLIIGLYMHFTTGNDFSVSSRSIKIECNQNILIFDINIFGHSLY